MTTGQNPKNEASDRPGPMLAFGRIALLPAPESEIAA